VSSISRGALGGGLQGPSRSLEGEKTSPRQVGCLGPGRRYLEESWQKRDMTTLGWCRTDGTGTE
jgi:hypothetical protein